MSIRVVVPLLTSLLALSCAADKPIWARARVVEQAEDLVGGPRALGEVGDFRIENDQMSAIVQGPTHSRMLGIYGGGLIDADLNRPRGEPNSSGGVGFDAFGELFPIFLLQAVEVTSVEIDNDGSNGGAARVIATGTAGDFIELAGVINRLLLGSHEDFAEPLSEQRLRYELIYELRPAARHIEMTLRVTNIAADTLTFPSDEASRLAELAGISGDQLPVPIGDVAAFSASSQAFIPGIGFDLRFGIEDAAGTARTLPALPGVVAPFVATRGHNVSYGLVAAEDERNYAWLNRDQYEEIGVEITRSSVFIPFAAGGFVTVFYSVAPPILGVGETFETKRYFVLGSGDIGSIVDEMYRIQQAPTGRFGGHVVDALTNAPAEDASVFVYTRLGTARRIFSQYDVHDGGSFGGNLTPGDYSLRVGGPGRVLSGFLDFAVAEGRATPLTVTASAPARLVVHVRDELGQPLPAKATVIGTYGTENLGRDPRNFLYDLRAGERARVQDLVPDDPADPTTRRYVEATGFTRDGAVELLVRPGSYEVVSSRGPEYDVQSETVELRPGATAVVRHTLPRVVDTTGWIAADMHLHARNSHDSSMELDERVRSIAAEGVEWAVSSDHNYITDYGPAIVRTGLFDWMQSSIGLEVTTIESGHFNGYPLRYDLTDVQRGAVEWSDRSPDQIFDALRALGEYGPDQTLIQVNHPRSPVLGYFGQYKRDSFSMNQLAPTVVDMFLAPSGPAFLNSDGSTTFSFDFDLLEVVNGKTFREIHSYRTPETLPPDAPMDLPPFGTIVTKDNGQAAFPGAVEDWYNLLNQGFGYIAVGTSDSHGPRDEAGYFRTLIFVGEDDPRRVSELDLVAGLRSRRVIATNGPVVDFFIDDPVAGVMGQTITAGGDSVNINIDLRAAPWVSVSRLNVVRNGAIADIIDVDPNRDLAADPLSITANVELARDEAGQFVDSWFVVEAVGYRSLFPVVPPLEVSKFQITEAITTLTGGVDVFGPGLGSATPSENLVYTPYAITNPVWVTRDGSFTPSGPLSASVQAAPENDSGFPRGQKPPQSLVGGSSSALRSAALPPWLFGRNPDARHDIGAIFRRAALGHSHD